MRPGNLRLLALAVVVLALSACGEERPRDDQAPTRLCVLSYNIHHGADKRGASNLDRVASLIRSLDPDVVALQEVDDRTTRSNGLDQAREIGERAGYRFVFGKAMDFAGGGYGEAVLTKHPIVSSRNHPLPHEPGAN